MAKENSVEIKEENGISINNTKKTFLGLTYGHLFLRDLEGALVSLLRLVHDFLSSITSGNLGEVSVVISLHFQVEDLRLAGGGLKRAFRILAFSYFLHLGDEVLVQKAENDLADVLELLLDFFAVFLGVQLVKYS